MILGLYYIVLLWSFYLYILYPNQFKSYLIHCCPHTCISHCNGYLYLDIVCAPGQIVSVCNQRYHCILITCCEPWLYFDFHSACCLVTESACFHTYVLACCLTDNFFSQLCLSPNFEFYYQVDLLDFYRLARTEADYNEYFSTKDMLDFE